MQLFLQFLRDERGATAIEYAIIGGLLTVAIAGFVYRFGEQMRDNFFLLLPEAIGPQ